LSNLDFEKNYNLHHIKERFKTEEMCKIAVKKNGNQIEYVPKKFINNKLINEAILFSGICLKKIKKKFITEEICFKCFKL
jgi:hypothetical protein